MLRLYLGLIPRQLDLCKECDRLFGLVPRKTYTCMISVKIHNKFSE